MTPTQKPLMVLADANLRDLQAGPLTGINFYVVEGPRGYLAALQDGAALPLYADPRFYCVDDLLAGAPVPTLRVTAAPIAIQPSFPSRFNALIALQAAAISPAYTGATGAFPLIATDTLAVNTVFRRYLSTPADHRFVGGQLTAGTYLTSQTDAAHADSGFGAVGRYALPLPLPVVHVIQYELPAGTTIEIGTVAPNFGQSGGGVEVRLTSKTSATQVGALVLPEY
jgi:hypothetical protein